MGLAYVQVLLAVEERFGISIDDDEAYEDRTVGGLYAVVLAKLGHAPHAGVKEGCSSSPAFYRVRRTLMSIYGTPRSAVCPDAQLEDLVPQERRQAAWSRLWEELGASPPDLRVAVPAWFERLQCGLLVSAVVMPLVAWWAKQPWWWYAIAPWPALLVTMVAGRRMDLVLPAGFSTVRQVVTDLVARERSERTIRDAGRDDVWQALQDVICRELLVTPADVTPDALWVDLGAG